MIDGLFGIGLVRDIAGEYAALVDYANRQRCPVLALDIPSGVHSDTGRVLGHAVRATHTVTFIALKPGLLTLDGPDHCGALEVADLQIAAHKIVAPSAWVADPAAFKLLRAGPRNFHKGMAGSLAILGGAAGAAGAALLAGRAALKMGAGRVYVGLLSEEVSVDFSNPELMLRHRMTLWDQDLTLSSPVRASAKANARDAGRRGARERPALRARCRRAQPDRGKRRPAPCLRASQRRHHHYPASRGSRPAACAQDRRRAGRPGEGGEDPTSNLNAHVVLKGAGSILVARDGHWFINTSGNAGMASAGMGDVLAGILGALLAQRYSGESALVLGRTCTAQPRTTWSAAASGRSGSPPAVGRRSSATLERVASKPGGLAASQRSRSSFTSLAAEPAR